MESPTQELLDFVTGTHFEDLPIEVVHESKRILLDSIGVGIAALKTDKGSYGMALAKRFGKATESSILGTHERLSCGGAAFANGELINALEYDAVIWPTHAAPSLIPSSLALGESVGASGRDIILSTALGCELSIRLGAAVRSLKQVFTTEKGSEVGKIIGTKYSVSAVGVVVIAGTAGAGKVINLDQQKMAHAVGLAAHFTPFPQAKWKLDQQMPMKKQISAGWASLAEVTAVLLAEMGYTADPTALDGDLGFWRFFGGDLWNPEALIEKFGREWKMLKAVEYKPYPCCRDFHVALDCFIKIIDENKLMPKDIEKVRIQTNPPMANPPFAGREIVDHIAAQFSLPYIISAAANRVSLAEWQEQDRIRDPKILKLMDKVLVEAHPDFVKVQTEEPLSNMTTVEVVTKSKMFKKEGKYAKGIPQPEFARMTDEDLVKKFRVNVSKVLSQNKVEKAITYLAELEKEKNISEVVNQVTL